MANDFMNIDNAADPAAPQGGATGSLSELLERLEAKYPDDEDVTAAVDQFAAEYGDEDLEDDEFGMEFEEPEEAPADSEAADFEVMFAEDTAEDDEEEMPAKKKKKPAPAY
jgi:hypothetical protein